jgi:hypothetical protein
VGNALDRLLMVETWNLPILKQLRNWDTGSLPLACGLFAY